MSTVRSYLSSETISYRGLGISIHISILHAVDSYLSVGNRSTVLVFRNLSFFIITFILAVAIKIGMSVTMTGRCSSNSPEIGHRIRRNFPFPIPYSQLTCIQYLTNFRRRYCEEGNFQQIIYNENNIISPGCKNEIYKYTL